MNTPQDTISDEMGNTFIPISNIIDFINMQQNNLLLNKITPTPEQWAQGENKNTPASKQWAQGETLTPKQWAQDENESMPTPKQWAQGETLTPKQWAQGEIEKKAKIQKEQFLKQYFEMDVDATQNRPNIKNVNLDDENDIFQFAALQNIACAFSCCIDTTTPGRIEEIGKIFKGQNDGQFVHFVIYPSPKWGAIKLQNPKEALAYFEVYLKDEPQNDAEKADVMAQFRTLSHTVKNQNDHQ